MWTIDEIQDYLKKNIGESRYIHTLGVVKTAKELAKINNEDENKAEVAALVHDIAKQMPIPEQIEILKANGIGIDIVTENSPQILHGFVGAILASSLIGIKDDDIINAIKNHTVARKNMSTLEKIIYIADYIEPNRSYPGVEDLRKITYENLNEGVLQGIENTISFVMSRRQLVHPDTIDARNYLILEIKGLV